MIKHNCHGGNGMPARLIYFFDPGELVPAETIQVGETAYTRRSLADTMDCPQCGHPVPYEIKADEVTVSNAATVSDVPEFEVL